jgi:hypothetical protein
MGNCNKQSLSESENNLPKLKITLEFELSLNKILKILLPILTAGWIGIQSLANLSSNPPTIHHPAIHKTVQIDE